MEGSRCLVHSSTIILLQSYERLNTPNSRPWAIATKPNPIKPSIPFLSYTHFHRNPLMRLIPLNLKVPHLPPINTSTLLPSYHQFREIPRLPFQLYIQRIHVVQIHMRVSHRVNKRARCQATDMRQHVREECVGGDIEGHAETHIARALIQLAA